MAIEIATGYVSIVPSMRGFNTSLTAQVDQAAGNAGNTAGKSFKSGMLSHVKGIAAGLVGAFAITKGLDFFKGAIGEASNLNESVNAVNVTFGKSAKGIKTLADQAATSVGLSKNEFNGLAVQFSNFAQTVAGPGGDVVQTMDDLTTRASDFASVMNLDVNEAATLFQSGLAGETEPLRRYGIDMSAAAVQAHAMAKGIWNGTGEMTEAQKVQARYSLLMKSTTKTAGDFANTSDSLANRQRIANAQWSNAKASIGQSLLPIMTTVTAFIQDKVVPAVQQFGDWFQRDGAPALGRFGATLRDNVLPPLRAVIGWMIENRAVLLPIAGIIATMVAAWKTYAFIANMVKLAQIALNIAMAANPIGLIVVAVAGLVAALVLLFQKNETFRNVVLTAWEAIKSAAQVVWNAIKVVIEFVWNYITTYIRTYIAVIRTVISVAWEVIKTVTQTAWNLIKAFIIDPIVAVWNRITEVVGNLKTWLAAGWAVIRDKAAEVWQAIRTAIVTPITRVWEALSTIVETIKTNLSNAWTAIKDRAAEIWGNIAGAIANKVSGWWDTIKDYLVGENGIKGKIEGVWVTIKDNAGETWTSIMDAIKKPISDAVDWIEGKFKWLLDLKDKFLGGGSGGWGGGWKNDWAAATPTGPGGGAPGAGSGVTRWTGGAGSPGATWFQAGSVWSWAGGHHNGVDVVGTGAGAPIYTTRPGVVSFAGNSGDWAGNNVQVRLPGGVTLQFAHMSSINARAGQIVRAGSMIGRVGDTGNSYGAHLHVSAIPPGGGTYINPIPFLAKGGMIKASPGGTLALMGEARRDEAVIPLPPRLSGASGMQALSEVLTGGGGRVHNTFNLDVSHIPTEEATVAAWRRWEALQGV